MSAQQMLERWLKQAGDVARQPGFGSGAATGGVIGLLLGSAGGRRMGGKMLKVGGLAALGVMAWKAYEGWQAQQGQQAQTAGQAGGAVGQPAGAAPAAPPRTVDRLPAPEVDLHSRAILQAMVAAAKADGHLDERERSLIEGELGRRAADAEERGWLEAELRRPLDPAEVARAAATPEMGAEMYLASLLVTDEQSFMERAYLDELARQLKLPDGLKTRLEAEARAAG